MSSTASNGAARQSPDERLRSACRGGGQIKSSRGGLPAGLIFLTVHNSKCGSGLAREGGLTAGQFLADWCKSNCGIEPARESGVSAHRDL